MMTKTIEAEAAAEGNGPRKGRDRLDALRTRRATAAPSAAGQGDFGDDLDGIGGDAKRDRQKKLLMKVYRVMTQTPDDGRGLVNGTPFTEAGVERLMSMLDSRKGESEIGAKVAAAALNFISPSDGEEATVSGASVAKLQNLASRIDTFRGKAGARRRQSW